MQRRGLWQGGGGAVVVGAVTWLLPEALRLPWLRGLLWLTVGIYLGMAWMDSPRALRVQAIGGLPVAGLALASLVWPALLVVAWALHPIWDLLHHWGIIRTRIHPIVVPFCIVFDALVAGVAAAVMAGIL